MPEPISPERLAQLKQRWERDPNSRLFLQLAEEYRRAGRLDEAVSTLDEGLSRHPSYLSAQVAMGRCLLEAGQPARAKDWLERAIRQDPTQLVANKLLVESHLALGDLAHARERLDLYHLLNDGDSEIDRLESRLRQLGSEASSVAPRRRAVPDERSQVEVFALPKPVELPEIELPPARSASLARVEVPREQPFGTLYPELAGRTILRAFERAGIFAVASPPPSAAPRRMAALALATPGLVEVLEPELAAPAAALSEPETAAEVAEEIASDLVFSPRQAIGAELEAVESEEPPAVAPPAAEPAPTSTTLGELYLAQGHFDEAERSFLAVLAQRPGDAAAAVGLEATRRQRRLADEEFAEPSEAPSSAPAVPGRLAARKIALLKDYLARLRRRA